MCCSFSKYYVRTWGQTGLSSPNKAGVYSIPSFLKQIAPSVPAAQPPERRARDPTYVATLKHRKTIKQTQQKMNQTKPPHEIRKYFSFCWPGGICRKGSNALQDSTTPTVQLTENRAIHIVQKITSAFLLGIQFHAYLSYTIFIHANMQCVVQSLQSHPMKKKKNWTVKRGSSKSCLLE